jgi:F-type H+-transporting ATPase subunit gamma
MQLKCATQQEASTDSTAGNQKPVPRDSFGKTKNQKLKMPGQLKEVRNRIKSVQSSQQITKAMKMVSAAKLRRAQEAIIQMRPYARKLQELLSNIVSNSDGGEGIGLAVERPIERVLLIVITSDRGLAGAFNSNLIKLAKQTINEKYSAQFAKGNVTIWSIGKKNYEHFIKNNYKADATFKDIFLHLSFEAVQAACTSRDEGI